MDSAIPILLIYITDIPYSCTGTRIKKNQNQFKHPSMGNESIHPHNIPLCSCLKKKKKI